MPPANYGANLEERLGTDISQWTEALRSFSRRLRVAVPGVVMEFDATRQTVSVQPTVLDLERINGVMTPVYLPLLKDVPVLLPRFGGWALTGPIQKDDECLVVFADLCIDGWWESGQIVPPHKDRRHSLSDAFAIFGPWSQPRKLTNYSTTSAQLRNEAGDVVIDLAANQITVTAQNVNVHAAGTATVEGSTVNVTGSSAVHISGSGSTSIEGKDWLTHKHLGVQTGGGVSGVVL